MNDKNATADKMHARARALGADELRPSWRKNKKYVVKYKGKYIHFRQRGYEDYTTHHDPVRRAAYRSVTRVSSWPMDGGLQSQNNALVLGL